MRSPDGHLPSGLGEPTLPDVGVVAWNHIAIGPRPGDLQDFIALGATDEERLFACIGQQPDPSSIVDAECDSRLAQAAFTTLSNPREELWTDHTANYDGDNVYRTMPMRESERTLFELHSMGAESYLSAIDPSEVPADGRGTALAKYRSRSRVIWHLDVAWASDNAGTLTGMVGLPATFSLADHPHSSAAGVSEHSCSSWRCRTDCRRLRTAYRPSLPWRV